MTARRTTVRIDPRPWLSLGLQYPLSLGKSDFITIDFDGVGTATERFARAQKFINDADVIARCPQIRALVVRVLLNKARELDRFIKVLSR